MPRNTLSLILFFYIAQVLSADSNDSCNFANEVNYGANDRPRSLATGDLDADGDIDIVVANEFDASVSVLLNNSDGTFENEQKYGANFLSNAVDVGDFDNDNMLDIVVGNRSGNISVLLNNGNGTFADQVTYETSDGGPGFVIAIDVDGDLDIDIATINGPGSSSLSIFLNNGNGTFVEDANYDGMGSGALDLAAGDFDSDGDSDFLFPNGNTDTLVLMKNNGDGTLAAPIVFESPVSPKSIDVGDLDNDSDLDVCLSVGFGNKFDAVVLINNGNGVFTLGQEFELDETPDDLRCSALKVYCL